MIEGLKVLKEPCQVTVYSDSRYVIDCMNDRWFDNWRLNGWKDSARKAVVNRELWEQLLDAVENRGHTVTFVKVKGHATCLVALPARQSATTSVATNSPLPRALCSSTRTAP